MTDAAAKTVTLVSPDGEVGRVPVENVARALELGFTKPNEGQIRESVNRQYFGGTEGTIEATGLGLLRGATVGLSDLALKGAGVASSEHLRTVKEQSPTASLVSEIGGNLAGTLIGAAPAGLISSAGTATAKAAGGALGGLAARGLAGRVAAKGLATAAGGALEGAIYGAAQAVDESVLGDTELTAEKVLAHAGWGSVFGGTAGAVLGGGLELGGAVAKKAAEKVSEKLGEGGVKEWLRNFAEERALKATLGRQKRAFDLLETKGRREEAQSYLLDKIGIEAGDTTESIAEKLAAKQGDLKGQLQAVVKTVDEATEASPLQRLSPRQVANRVEEEVAAPLGKLAAERDTHALVQREIEAIHDLGNGGMSFQDALEQRQAYQGKIKYAKINGLTSTEQAYNKIAKIWNDVIDEHVEPVLAGLGYPEAQGAYRSLRHEFSLVSDLTDYAVNRVRGNEAIRFVQPSDYGVGAAVGVMTGGASTAAGLAKGAVAGVAHKIVRERGNAVLASIADKASRLRVLERSAQSFDAQVTKAVDTFIQKAAPATLRVVPAATRIMQETPLAAPLKRVAGDDKRAAYKKRVAELRHLSTDPKGFADQLATSLRHVTDAAPKLATVIQAKTSQAAAFLLEKAPKNPLPPTGFSVLKEWEPADSQIAKWARYYAAVADPMSVLEDLKSGTVSQEGVETLKVVYPKLYDYVKRKVIERVSEAETPPPYRDRISLSILFDVPLDPTMRPDFIAMIKAQHDAQQQQQPLQQGGGSGSAQSKYAAAMMTPSQRLLER